MVTLVGTGGVGKTRLALQVAAELVDQFDGGVWWAELAPLTDPASIPGAVLSAMGVPPQPGVRPVTSLGDQLEGRSALFVLDNCEHLIGACAAFVDELLTALHSRLSWRPAASRSRCLVSWSGGFPLSSCLTRHRSRQSGRSSNRMRPVFSRSGPPGATKAVAHRQVAQAVGANLHPARRHTPVDRTRGGAVPESGDRADLPRARRPFSTAHRWRPHGAGSATDLEGLDRLES